jgi:hypothetical protein
MTEEEAFRACGEALKRRRAAEEALHRAKWEFALAKDEHLFALSEWSRLKFGDPDDSAGYGAKARERVERRRREGLSPLRHSA